MLVAFTEGAVIHLGMPFLLKLCRTVLSSWGFELDLHVWKGGVLSNISSKEAAGRKIEINEVLRTDQSRCRKLQSKESLSLALFQRPSGLVSNCINNSQKMVVHCSSMMNDIKSGNTQLKRSVPWCSVDGSELINMSLPDNMVEDLYCCFKEDAIFSGGIQEYHCWNRTEILQHAKTEELVCQRNSETVSKEDFKVHLFKHFPTDLCAVEDMMSIRDCVYNQKGQLVQMFICFDSEHSDTSSEVCASDSDCSDSASDSEDFIVFENLCVDEDQLCPGLEFVCETSELQRETCTQSLVLTTKLYCEVTAMESFEHPKMDSFVQEFILHKGICNEECECTDDLVSTVTYGKTVPKQKKKVQFMPDDQLTVVHSMFVWNFAYRQARKGTWEADALDRLRFQKRVKDLDEILTPVLLAKKEKLTRETCI